MYLCVKCIKPRFINSERSCGDVDALHGHQVSSDVKYVPQIRSMKHQLIQKEKIKIYFKDTSLVS